MPNHFRWVYRTGLTLCQLLPVYPEQRTSSGRSGMSEKCQTRTFALYAMRVSTKKSASGLTIEFIATCSEFTCSPCCLTYSYAACSRSKSG